VTHGKSWVDWEHWALEEFFLEPGAHGPIECVEVTDAHVTAFARTDDLNAAARMFAVGLGPQSLAHGWLSGTKPPPTHGRPWCARILVFACWVQVTSLRRSSDRVFEDLLADRLGLASHPGVRGLPSMWEALRRWLWEEHRVDLRLPAGSFRWVGYTVRLPFPTWRDLQRLRGIRDGMRPADLDSRRMVAERIRFADEAKRTPAFERKFEEWYRAVRVGDPGVAGLAFDRAWTRIASEKVGTADLLVVEDEFGGLRLEIVERGAVTQTLIPFDGDDDRRLASSTRAALRSGVVTFASQGFGRWVATSDPTTAAAHLAWPAATHRLDGFDPAKASRVEPIGWLFASWTRPPRITAPESADQVAEARRADGIRVGSALLGRTPMTPRWFVTGSSAYSFVIEDDEVAAERSGQVIGFPEGIWRGTVHLRSEGRDIDGFRLAPEAAEHAADVVKAFDTLIAIPEDGPLYDTAPAVGVPRTARHHGSRSDPGERMTALSEAVYAKSRSGIPMGELIGLAGRAIEGLADAPSPWDLLRSFVDGGWLEPGAVAKVAARIFFPRPPCFRQVREGGDRLLVLDGMAGLAVRRRVSECADALGLRAAELGGVGPWSLLRMSIGPTVKTSETALAARTGLVIAAAPETISPPASRWRADSTTIGYDVPSRWEPTTARFEAGEAETGIIRLTKRDRSRMDQPPIYVIGDHDGEEILKSPVLAMLRYIERTGGYPFAARGSILVRSVPRVVLPAVWGRWLSMRALACAGPIEIAGVWTYAYPADREAVRTLNRLCAVSEREQSPRWADRLQAARRDDVPSMSVAGRLHLNLHARSWSST